MKMQTLIASLLLISISVKADDVLRPDMVVNIPTVIQDRAFFQLNGNPLKNQSSSYVVCKMTSTDVTDCRTLPLNTMQGMKGEGLFLVTYSGTSAIVEMKKKTTTTINLRTIAIPEIDGSYQYETIVDFTSYSEKEKAALVFISQAGDSFCSQSFSSENMKDYCELRSAKKGLRVLQEWVMDKFFKIEMMSAPHENGYIELKAALITKGTDSQSPIYVLPGTYFVRFTNSLGEQADVPGFEIK